MIAWVCRNDSVAEYHLGTSTAFYFGVNQEGEVLAWRTVTGLGDQGSSAGSANQISHSHKLTKTTYHFCYHEGVLHKHILYIKSVLNPAQVRRLVPTAPEGAS